MEIEIYLSNKKLGKTKLKKTFLFDEDTQKINSDSLWGYAPCEDPSVRQKWQIGNGEIL